MLLYLRNKKAAEDAGIPYGVMCPVGLEKLISNDFMKKRELSRKLVKAAVLMEQARIMSHEHEYDRQERIAAASRKHSEWSRSQALSVGTFQSIAARID